MGSTPRTEVAPAAAATGLPEDSPAVADAAERALAPGLREPGASFRRLAWVALVYNLLVVGWGAFVRASFSGDGCGRHWPLCDGEIVPGLATHQQAIEFTHRISSGLTIPLGIALLVVARRTFAAGHLARRASGLALGMLFFEALIGAGLVIFGLVARHDGPMRAAVMSIHMASTFVLVGALAACVLSPVVPRLRYRGQGAVAWALGIGFGLLVVLGVSGALSALGHMLQPRPDVLTASVTPGEHWLVRLQPFHPFIATSIGVYLAFACGLVAFLRPDRRVAQAARLCVGLYGAQMLIGLVNIFLAAPAWMQVVHLVFADLIWASLVAVGVFALAEGATVHSSEDAEPIAAAPRASARELLRAYVQLTKPKVISLLLFTALAASFAAAGGWPGWIVVLTVALGGYMAAGAANAVNMALESDLDGRMRRTSRRPTVTHLIPPSRALAFGAALMTGSFTLLWWATTLLAAVMALSGFAFYVLIYTVLLKRRTWHNIVIGGAAGAFPPLVGYAAVTGTLSPLAWFLFALIFLWTPVHFWALALMIKDDYAEAGVPMLPVVRGERATIVQITLYAILTAAISVFPLVQREVGWVYFTPSVFLNTVLIAKSFQLLQHPERPQAVSLYKYSMVYLALVFLVVAIDRAVQS